MKYLQALIAVVVLFCLTSCAEEVPPGSVVISIDAEPALRSEIRVVRILIQGRFVGETVWRNAYEGTIDVDSWPLTTVIASGNTASPREYFFQAEAFGAVSNSLGTVRRLGDYFAEGVLYKSVRFTSACVEFSCPDIGTQCLSNGGSPSCEDAWERFGSNPDASVFDAGSDAGTLDAAPQDSGP